MEKDFERNQGYARISLFIDFFLFLFDVDLYDGFFIFLCLIYPVVECYSAISIFFDFVSDFKAWYLIFLQYFVKGRRANAELLGYCALFFIIIFYPLSKFFHFFTIIYMFCIDKYSDIRIY